MKDDDTVSSLKYHISVEITEEADGCFHDTGLEIMAVDGSLSIESYERFKDGRPDGFESTIELNLTEAKRLHAFLGAALAFLEYGKNE
jgi:CO dehydrogenase/acetyl-CoA synthase beta subunit